MTGKKPLTIRKMTDNDTWESLARIVALLTQIDTECTAHEGMPGSDETREAFLWLLNTAELNQDEEPLIYDVTVPDADIVVRFAASLTIEDAHGRIP